MSAESNWVIDHVLGTCDADYTFFQDFAEFLGIQDELHIQDIFYQACEEAEIQRCESCGWWVCLHELDTQNNCGDCSDDY